MTVHIFVFVIQVGHALCKQKKFVLRVQNDTEIICFVYSHAMLLQGATLHDVIRLVVRLSMAGSPTTTARSILSNFCFLFFSKFFHPKFFFTSKKIFPLSLFYAFLDISCHPKYTKKNPKTSPQIFLMSCGWSKVRYNATKHSGFQNTSDKGQFGFLHIRIRCDPPVSFFNSVALVCPTE